MASVLWDAHLLCPEPDNAQWCIRARGPFQYFHYGCDGLDDRGWGCGYRTLQSLCSWVRQQKVGGDQEVSDVPSIPQIQEALVAMEDKPQTFVSSKQWIGSVEVGLVVDYFFDVPCKIIHIPSGDKLQQYIQEIKEHFSTKGSPIMMGGDSDAASKGICGVCEAAGVTYLLVLDPHFYGKPISVTILQEESMLLWRPLDSFMKNSFYNICLPQLYSKIT